MDTSNVNRVLRPRSYSRAAWRRLSLASASEEPIHLCLIAVFLMLWPTIAGAQNSSFAPTKTAVLAGGCFWCIQPAFDKATGVIKTVVGYCGGTEPNPTYELVSSERTR